MRARTINDTAKGGRNLSAEHSIDFGLTRLFGDRFGNQLPFSNERRLKLFIVGCYPLIRFPMNSIPTNPEEVIRPSPKETNNTGHHHP